MTVVRSLPVLVLLVVAAGTTASALATSESAKHACPERTVGEGYVREVARALSAGRDVWGNALLARPGGPSYDGARSYLKPLLLAKAPQGRLLTDSGVYYMPFAEPFGANGAESVALHVADGSQIVSQHVGGRALTVAVGSRGRERYGSCLGRLEPPTLASGYLPILDTRYTDADGVRYEQESFAARIRQTRSLVSFVRVTADARRAGVGAQVRFTPSVGDLGKTGDRLVDGKAAYLLGSPGAAFDQRSIAYAVPSGGVRTVYAAWLNTPSPTGDVELSRAAYDAARRGTIDYWTRRLDEGTIFVVPERRVLDAERGLLVQNLELTWRYSIGNPYEEFSFPESVDVAQVMASYGHRDVARAILRTSLGRKPRPYPNWKMGEKLVASALYYRLYADRRFLDQTTPILRGYVRVLGRQISERGRGLLHRERYSSDIADSVYGLHSQAVAWQGLRAMGQVWAMTGRRPLALECRKLAARLETGLREAVRASQRRLPDGSLFVPVRLLGTEETHDALVASRSGSYWNLVMPYALASGLFAPGSAEARGAVDYMARHGSRLLGLVRAAAFALYGQPEYPTSGTDEVYGVNVARFLADNDRADLLVLSLYGHLAAGMTENTHISGEAASIAPLGDEYYRSMYLPPNSASNAALLETLRLMLVQETRDSDGRPNGLRLAYATPRAWLKQGRRIVVRSAPTSFGPISFSLESARDSVRVLVEVPDRARPSSISLRLRLPEGSRIAGATLDGQPFSRFDPAKETIDLSGEHGRLELVVGLAHR